MIASSRSAGASVATSHMTIISVRGFSGDLASTMATTTAIAASVTNNSPGSALADAMISWINTTAWSADNFGIDNRTGSARSRSSLLRKYLMLSGTPNENDSSID